MKMIIYHGSIEIIEKPIYGYGNPHNDYGLGFYCTQNLDLAKEWATRNKTDGYVNAYQLDLKSLKVLDLTSDKYDVLNWVAILLKHKQQNMFIRSIKDSILKPFVDKYYIDVSKYDVVIGYRADDAYYAFPKAFIYSEITVDRLKEIYRLGELETQIVLISEKAFEQISYMDSVNVDMTYSEYYDNRIKEAARRFNEILIEARYENGLRIRDLLEDKEDD